MVAARHGRFPRDPTLKDFLKSPQAAVSSLRLLLAWMHDKSEQDCREIIENYVLSGDQGLTVVTLREACGLAISEDTLPEGHTIHPAPPARKPTHHATSLTVHVGHQGKNNSPAA